MKPKIVLLGGGGHCASVIDVIEQEGKYEIRGIVDKKEKVVKKVLGYPVIGTDDDIPDIIEECKNFIITIGQIKSSSVRRRIAEKMANFDLTFPVIVSPLAYVSPHAQVGAGTVVMNGAVLNAGVQVGIHCIINSKALLEHDSVLGDFCHISTAAVINGEVVVASDTFIGSNAVVNQGVSVPRGVVIGSGSVVTKPDGIEENNMYAGNPLRRIGPDE